MTPLSRIGSVWHRTCFRVRWLLAGRKAREKFGDAFWEQAGADLDRLMVEHFPNLRAASAVMARSFAEQVERHFAYLQREFGFSIVRSGEFTMGVLSAVMGNGGTEIGFHRWRDEFSIVITGSTGREVSALALFPSDSRVCLWSDELSFIHTDLFANMDDEEHGERKMAKWADVLYPFWPRLLEKANVATCEETRCERLERNAQDKAARKAKLSVAKEVRISQRISARLRELGFLSMVQGMCTFLESEYNFHLATEKSNPCLARFERRGALKDSESAVAGIDFAMGISSVNPSALEVNLWLRVRVAGDPEGSTRDFLLDALIDQVDHTGGVDGGTVISPETLRTVLTEKIALLRKHCGAALKGDLGIFHAKYARKAAFAKETAVAWARQEAQRAWQEGDWSMVRRIYGWMGSACSAEETRRLAEAKSRMKHNAGDQKAR